MGFGSKFTFLLPSLPREIYLALKGWCESHRASQWQAVSAAIAILVQMPDEATGPFLEAVRRLPQPPPPRGTPPGA